MKYMIVADSSANVFHLEGVNYTTVPMKIRTSVEYVDTPDMDLNAMVQDLKTFKDKSTSSCPNVQEWIDAFGDAEWVFCVTITKHLSGSYNAAKQAVDIYMEEHPGRKGFVFDSLSAGPELMMIVDKVRELADAGNNFDTIRESVLDYSSNCHTMFCLESLTNLARNGRVSPAVAKVASVLGIRMVGCAIGGTIVPVQKPRGEKKALQALMQVVRDRGFRDGNLMRIAHCYAPDKAEALMEAVRAEFPNARFIVEHTTALCSFYAEVGGLIVGFEGAYNDTNDKRQHQ